MGGRKSARSRAAGASSALYVVAVVRPSDRLHDDAVPQMNRPTLTNMRRLVAPLTPLDVWNRDDLYARPRVVNRAAHVRQSQLHGQRMDTAAVIDRLLCTASASDGETARVPDPGAGERRECRALRSTCRHRVRE